MRTDKRSNRTKDRPGSGDSTEGKRVPGRKTIQRFGTEKDSKFEYISTRINCRGETTNDP